MNRGLRQWLALLLLIGSLLGLPACGGDDDGGEEVVGDSPEGIPVEQLDDEDNEDDEGEGVPLGSAGVEIDEVGEEESLTDGQ